MVNTKDLMIGNYLSDNTLPSRTNRSLLRVLSITKRSVEVAVVFDAKNTSTGKYLSIKNVSTVGLSQESLIGLFGFVKKPNMPKGIESAFIVFEGCSYTFEYQTIIKTGDSALIVCQGDNCIKIDGVKHLHQLQNAIKCIAGVTLELSK